MLISSAITQAQIQGSELTYPQIYIIYERLGHLKALVLLIESFTISMRQDHNRITRMSPSEYPILMLPQKLKISNQTLGK